MALIICPECRNKISDRAGQCIHCGCPVEKKKVYNNKKKQWYAKSTAKIMIFPNFINV